MRVDGDGLLARLAVELIATVSRSSVLKDCCTVGTSMSSVAEGSLLLSRVGLEMTVEAALRVEGEVASVAGYVVASRNTSRGLAERADGVTLVLGFALEGAQTVGAEVSFGHESSHAVDGVVVVARVI